MELYKQNSYKAGIDSKNAKIYSPRPQRCTVEEISNKKVKLFVQ